MAMEYANSSRLWTKTVDFAGVAGVLAGYLKTRNSLKSIDLPELPELP